MIIESQYDETTGTVTFRFDTTFAGARPVPGLTPQSSVITLTKAEAMKLPGAKISTSPDGSIITVKVDSSQLKKEFADKVESFVAPKPKVKEDRPIAEWDKFEQERSSLVSAEVRKKEAYRKTIAIDKKSLLSRENVSYDPVTGVVQFNTPEDKDTDQLSARGGNLNPTYAVILPNDKYYETDKSAVAVDSIVAQEELITGLRMTNSIDKFKLQLLDSGYYDKANMDLRKVRQSRSKTGIADEYMRVAITYFLADYSTANAENILNDTATFSYDEFLTNYKPDFTEETAYVPSADDANAEIDKAYLENVGRRATDKEKKAFFAALQSEALSKPLRQTFGLSGGPDVNFAGFSEDDLAGFAEEYSLGTPASKEYAKGYGGYEAFNNSLNTLIKDLETPIATIEAPIPGNRNAV